MVVRLDGCGTGIGIDKVDYCQQLNNFVSGCSPFF
jgi:hypothetical protein